MVLRIEDPYMVRSLPACPWWRLAAATGLLLLAALLPLRAATAQDTLRAAIIVNDEVISELELIMRLRLALASSGLRETEEARLRLQPQVMRQLVDELLQLQEARRLGIAVDEARVDEAFGRVAANNGLTPEQLTQALLSSGILPDYLKDQIRAQIRWQAVVARRLRPQVQVDPEEIDEAVQRIAATSDQPQRLLAEIFLAVDSVEQEAEVRELAYRLHDEIKKGANFPAVARQFSQAASAGAGGDLGWVEAGQLPADIEEAVKALKPGDLSDPVETLNGYYLILMRDERQAPESAVTVALKQILFVPANNSKSAVEAAARKAQDAAKKVTGCADVEAVAKEMGAAENVDLGTQNTAELPSQLRQFASSQPLGQPSQPIQVPGGIAIFFVCDRQDGGINRQLVEERLVREKLEVLARRYMRDLRRAANIEIRI
jgi:peptidyl-prolyl cis-trans isomerase SurA